MENNLMKINPNDIVTIFFVDDKKYAALRDVKDENSVYFALISQLDEEKDLYTHVPEEDIDRVIAEFEKTMNFFEGIDELDESEGDL